MINVQKLSSEFSAAGITIGGCNSSGVVWGEDGMTEIQNLPEVQAIIAAHNPDGKTWDQIRFERAQLLSNCDWTQMADAALTIEEKAAWQDYRQALRDIPQVFAIPDDVAWPVAPGA